MKTFARILAIATLASAPAFAGANKTTDFDVSVHKVTNQVAGGSVEITALSKVEALSDGIIVSESSFFFPADAQALVAKLSEPESIRRLTAFATGVRKEGASSDGQGWAGTMTIDATKMARTFGRDFWVRDLKNLTQGHGQYNLKFEVHTTTAGRATTLRFDLLDGKVFSKLTLEITVTAGAPAASLVSIQSRTNSKLGSSVGDRISLAKRIVRDSATILDHAFKAE